MSNRKIIQHIRLIQFDLEYMEFYLIFALKHMDILLRMTDDEEIKQINVNMRQLKKRVDEVINKDWDKLVGKYEKE